MATTEQADFDRSREGRIKAAIKHDSWCPYLEQNGYGDLFCNKIGGQCNEIIWLCDGNSNAVKYK